jgi:phospholipase C
MSDNYHQAVQGGTGANHIALGIGYAAFYQDTNGKAVKPPSNEVENPDPKATTNNNFTQDGYSGGSYSDCADPTQPGVGPIRSYLAGLPYKPLDNCQPGHYYLLNNYNAGFNVDGSVNTSPFTAPPQYNWPTIVDQLTSKHISWGYFGEAYNGGHPTSSYCGICDPFQYSASVMTNPAERKNIQHDSTDFDASVAKGGLPAVSFLKPGDDDGHPAYSTLAAFEQFVAHTVDEVQNQPKLWKSTAIFVTMDEGGGYYDSGYVQPVSFFGDGPRVPMIVVSPYTKPGDIDHTYNDHVSILKFIEANWSLHPVSSISEDNLPDPTGPGYVPSNRAAIGDLMSLFDFSHAQSTPATPAAWNARSSQAATPHSDQSR